MEEHQHTHSHHEHSHEAEENKDLEGQGSMQEYNWYENNVSEISLLIAFHLARML